MRDKKNVSRRAFLAGGTALTGAIIAEANKSVFDKIAIADDGVANPPVLVESEQWKHGDIVECDLLVIGSGIAGLWAAIKAADADVGSIAIVDKGSIGFSSISSLIAGSSVYVFPGESVDGVMREVVKVADYLSRQDIWEDMLNSSADLYQEVTERLGIEYKGTRFQSDGNKYTTLISAPVYNGVGSGRGYVMALMDQIRNNPNIKYYSKTIATKILKNEARACGIIGVNRVTGDALAIKSKATILATGQCSFRGQHALMEVNTGDGYALAYDAGATLNNLEFWAFDIDPVGYGFEGGSLLPAYGARMINNQNDEFMWDVDPINGPGGDVRYTTRAMAQEIKSGRGPIYLDRTTYEYVLAGQFAWHSRLQPGTWRLINDDRIEETGHNVCLDPELYTANSFGIIGAIKIGVDCATTVPGLFAASVAISADPGKTKGIESARAAWSGRKAGESAAAYISTTTFPVISDEDIQEAIVSIVAPLQEGTEAELANILTPTQVTEDLQKILFDYRVSILKSEGTLVKALRQVSELKALAEEYMVATDPHEIAKYYETKNMLQIAVLHLAASIERKESRVCHYREDFPERNDAKYLKWICFTKGADDEPEMTLEDVPIENYPFKPES
jgi:succinate dehydrogenase/fumarate reductase flavoprotein subunit